MTERSTSTHQLMIESFCNWLGSTSLSAVVQQTAWIIPTVQTIHILSIAVLVSSAVLLCLKLIGVSGRDQSLGEMRRRTLPWMWRALGVLLLTGIILIVGEPQRSLMNAMFWTKMLLLGVAVSGTLVVQYALRNQPDVRQGSTQRNALRVWLRVWGSLSLLLWLAIIVAGRWIAYTDVYQ